MSLLSTTPARGRIQLPSEAPGARNDPSNLQSRTSKRPALFESLEEDTPDVRARRIAMGLHQGRSCRVYEFGPSHRRRTHLFLEQGGHRTLFLLQQTFHYAMTLMSAMFDTGCILVGSRALDWFVPGSSSSDSDWHFYVPCYKESVADMISALSRCGVVWHSESDRVIRELRCKGFAIVHEKTLRALASWTRHLSSHAAASLMGDEAQDMIRAFEAFGDKKRDTFQAYHVTMDSENRVRLEAHDSLDYDDQLDFGDDPDGSPSDILHGQIETPRGSERVQLIIGQGGKGVGSCMSYITSFYASHLQCFVGGWCAGHLYHKQAQERHSALWTTPSDQINKEALQNIENPQERGNVFASAQHREEPLIRTFGDESACLHDYGDFFRHYISPSNSDILSIWLKERRENIRSISWVDNKGSVHTSEPRRAWGRTFALGSGLSWYQQCRMIDFVTQRHVGSEGVIDPGFRSSVSHSLKGEYWAVPHAARSGTVRDVLRDATPFSWTL